MVSFAEAGTARVIGASEFYLRADQLVAFLDRKELLIWRLVGLLAIAMVVSLSAILVRASQTIVARRNLLRLQVGGALQPAGAQSASLCRRD